MPIKLTLPSLALPFLTVITYVSTILTTQTALANDCDAALGAPTQEQIGAFRKELLESAEDYAESFGKKWPYARRKEEIGNESEFIDARRFTSGHVINLAGNTDFLRMVYDFPLVENYHIADLMRGWAGTVTNPLFNFVHRLKWIAGPQAFGRPKAQITILDRGFLDHYIKYVGLTNVSATEAGEDNFQAAMRQDANHRRPLIFKVSWKSAAVGLVEKRFFYHPADLTSPTEIDEVLSTIPRHDLHAAFLFGIQLDIRQLDEEFLTRIFDHLSEGGSYIRPVYSWDEIDIQQNKDRQVFMDHGFSLKTIETKMIRRKDGQSEDWPLQIFTKRNVDPLKVHAF